MLHRSPLTVRRSAFTAVELVISLGVLTAAMAVALPSIQMAKQSVHQVLCMNNLRQIGVNTEDTINTGDGYLPDYFFQIEASANDTTYLSVLPRTASESGLSNYHEKLLLCASDSAPSYAPLQEGDGTVRNVPTSYGFNIDLLKCRMPYWKIGEVIQYSDLVMFFDGGMGTDVEGAYFGAHDFAQQTGDKRHSHSSEANVLYGDWHVEAADSIQAVNMNYCSQLVATAGGEEDCCGEGEAGGSTPGNTSVPADDPVGPGASDPADEEDPTDETPDVADAGDEGEPTTDEEPTADAEEPTEDDTDVADAEEPTEDDTDVADAEEPTNDDEPTTVADAGNNGNGNSGNGHSNNGHGNNADGVDSSNPGQGNGGPTGANNSGNDPSGGVDDESHGGGALPSHNNGNNNDDEPTTVADAGNTGNGNGNGHSNNGHGNNADGVDSSNPGQGRGGPTGANNSGNDPSNGVDDESHGGGALPSHNNGNNGGPQGAVNGGTAGGGGGPQGAVNGGTAGGGGGPQGAVNGGTAGGGGGDGTVNGGSAGGGGGGGAVNGGSGSNGEGAGAGDDGNTVSASFSEDNLSVTVTSSDDRVRSVRIEYVGGGSNTFNTNSRNITVQSVNGRLIERVVVTVGNGRHAATESFTNLAI